MKYDSQILAFIVVSQINYKSAGEPFATLLKTCHSRIGYFRSIFSLKQNNRNSILSRAATFILIERASIFYLSKDREFDPVEFHKWYWMLCADKYFEEWGRTEQLGQRFLQIIYQVRDELDSVPVMLYPEEDGYKKIAYSVAKRVIALTGSNYIQSEVQKLTHKLEQISEIFCSYLKDYQPSLEVVNNVKAFCNSKTEMADFFVEKMNFPIEKRSEMINLDKVEINEIVGPREDKQYLGMVKILLMTLAKEKDKCVEEFTIPYFRCFFLYSPNIEDYDYSEDESAYPLDLLFITILTSDLFTKEKYQSAIDETAIKIYENQKQARPDYVMSLSEAYKIVESVFDDIILVFICFLAILTDSKRGRSLSNDIKLKVLASQSESGLKVVELIDSISKSDKVKREELFNDFFELQANKVLEVIKPQGKDQKRYDYFVLVKRVFLLLSICISRSCMMACHDVYMEQNQNTLNLLEKVKSDTKTSEEIIRHHFNLTI